jgi:hypothetical protein
MTALGRLDGAADHSTTQVNQAIRAVPTPRDLDRPATLSPHSRLTVQLTHKIGAVILIDRDVIDVGQRDAGLGDSSRRSSILTEPMFFLIDCEAVHLIVMVF